MTQLHDYLKKQIEKHHRGFLLHRTASKQFLNELVPLLNCPNSLILCHNPLLYTECSADKRSVDLSASNSDWFGKDGSNKDTCLNEQSKEYPDKKLAAQTIPFSKARMVLGQEFQLVIFDARDGFDPDAFGIASGLVPAGGLFILLLPTNNHEVDHDFSRFIPYGKSNASNNNLFLDHINNQLSQAAFYQLNDDDFASLALDCDWLTGEQVVEKRELVATAEQQAILDSIKKNEFVDGPLIITAHRGRGKSALLGFVAAHWLKLGRNIEVTAPRVDSIRSVIDTVKRLIDVEQVSAYHLQYQSASLKFIPIDRLVNTESMSETILLVDEAAAIPTSVATRLISIRPRVILTTTTFGYEGSGQAFLLRVGQFVQNKWPHAPIFKLIRPIRWFEGDSLEQFTQQCLLICEPRRGIQANVAERRAGEIADVSFSEVNQMALVNCHQLMSDVFMLLQQAHYKTSPADLRLLLNAPDIRIFIAKNKGRVIAVALICIEGGLTTDIAQLIYEGKRRVQGHLMAQVIEQQLGHHGAACYRYARFQRIAVDEDYRKQGIGSELIAYVEAKLSDVDIIGSSFGFQEHVAAFWFQNQYKLIKVGAKPSTKAGERSLIVVKSIKKSLQPTVEHWYLLNTAVLRLNLTIKRDALVQVLISQLKTFDRLFIRDESIVEDESAIKSQLSAYLQQIFIDFGLGYRSLEVALPAITHCFNNIDNLIGSNNSDKLSLLNLDADEVESYELYQLSLALIATFVEVSCEMRVFIELSGEVGRKQTLLKLRSACKRIAEKFAK
jgi:tRNA(Met) cytidine acetyltransferase